MLTDDGRDCVLDYAGRVQDYLDQQNKGVMSGTYIGNNSGNVAVGSTNFTQNVITGLDTSKVLEFAAAVRQALPVLGLAEDEQSALVRGVEDLADLDRQVLGGAVAEQVGRRGDRAGQPGRRAWI